MGCLHEERNNPALALVCFEECLRIRQAGLGRSHPAVADAWITLGPAWVELAKANDELEFLDVACECLGHGKAFCLFISSREKFSRVVVLLPATFELTLALAIQRQGFENHHVHIASVLSQLGFLADAMEKCHTRIRFWTETVRICAENDVPCDFSCALHLARISGCHQSLHNWKEAKRHWNEVHAVFMASKPHERNLPIAQRLRKTMLRRKPGRGRIVASNIRSSFG